MAGVKTLADAKIKLTILTVPPADINAITLAELTAGIDASCLVAKSGTRFSPAGSNTISDPALCDESDASVFGTSNYEGSIVPFWFLDPDTGAYAEADNPVYEAIREKGSEVTYVLREGPEYTVEWAADDLYDAYVGQSDNPQRPGETSGYIKRTVPLTILKAALHKRVVAA